MRPPIDPLVSPCVRNCTLDEQQVCLGCGRTIDEILEWGNASPARREQIRAILPARLEQRRRW